MAAREFAEIWGEQMHAARHLRVVTGRCCWWSWSWPSRWCASPGRPQPKPLVVRVDEVGRAEAVAYEAMEAKADPLDPTTGFFLHRFVVDHYFAPAGNGPRVLGAVPVVPDTGGGQRRLRRAGRARCSNGSSDRPLVKVQYASNME